MSLGISHLERPQAPWILWIEGYPDPDLVERSLADIGLTTRVLAGTRMQTTSSLFGEFASRLNFPERFGHNWDALADCLTDLEWLHGLSYGLVVAQASHLLKKEPPSQLQLFFNLIWRVATAWSMPVKTGEDWDRPAKPFHLLLLDGSTNLENVNELFNSAGLAIGSLLLAE